MTNPTIDILLKRKSVRVFEDKEISPEIKDLIIKATMQAPTAGNSMFYSVIDVTCQKIKDKLAVTCDNQPFISKAPMVWVFVADYRRWLRKFEQAGCKDIRPLGMGDLLLAANDTVIAAHTACVAAEALGIGSCYIGDIIEKWEEHQKLFELPEYVIPVSMLVFGYPTQQQIDRVGPKRFPTEMIVFENTYKDLDDKQLEEYYPTENTEAYFNRKYSADFSLEMNRSSDEMIKNWIGK
jgi:Nitroreductase